MICDGMNVSGVNRDEIGYEVRWVGRGGVNVMVMGSRYDGDDAGTT